MTAVDNERELIRFRHNDGARIPVGGVLLLLATDPRYDDDHPIAIGYNIDVNENDQVAGLGINNPDSTREPARQKVIRFNENLPDDGNFLLIIRSPDNHENKNESGKGWAEIGGNQDIDKISDVAGYVDNLQKDNYPGTTPSNLNRTWLWPMINYNDKTDPIRTQDHGSDVNKRRHNQFQVNWVRYRQHVQTKLGNDNKGSVNRAGTGFTHKDRKAEHYAFRDAAYTGIGYKRTARILRQHNGTPGYHGNVPSVLENIQNTNAASVTISEIMYSTGPNADRHVYPQWIELYNSSPVHAVDLRNWKLRFEMLDADGNPMDSLMNLDFNRSRVKTISPQQTVLIVAGNARQAGSDSATGTVVFNDNRVFNVFRDYGGADKFGENTRYMFFNPKAFNIAVIDKDNKVVDQVGNLDGDRRTSDTNEWDMPAGVAEDGNRTSLIRVYDDGVARDGMNTAESNVMPVFGTGDKLMQSWTTAIDAKWSLDSCCEY